MFMSILKIHNNFLACNNIVLVYYQYSKSFGSKYESIRIISYFYQIECDCVMNVLNIITLVIENSYM